MATTKFQPRTDLEPLDVDDRRRIAMEQIRMQLLDGVQFTALMAGQAVLDNALDEDEADVLKLGDKIARRLCG